MASRKFAVLCICAPLFLAAGAAAAADPAQQPVPWANAADESGRPANPVPAGAPPNAASRGAAVPGASSASAQEPSRPPVHSKTTRTARASSTQSGSAAVGGSPSSSPAAASGTSSETQQQSAATAKEDRSFAANWSWLGLLGLFGLLGLWGRRRYEREPDAYERRSDDRAYDTPGPVARGADASTGLTRSSTCTFVSGPPSPR